MKQFNIDWWYLCYCHIFIIIFGIIRRPVYVPLNWCNVCNDNESIKSIISLIPRLSHRLSYLTFRTISWSWNSSTNYFMARAFFNTRPFSVIIHINPNVCRAKYRVCGTVKSELGQWIRINIGRARLKRNLDLISAFHCHCPRAQLLAAHTAAHQS